MPGSSLSLPMTALLSEVRRAASSASTLESLQQTVVEVLSRNIAHYSWTGFYMLDSTDPDTLVLGTVRRRPDVGTSASQ